MEYPYEKEPDFSSLTATLQQLSEVEEQPEPDHGPPPDRDPAHVYLQSLGQGTPRRTMASALELAARLLRREQKDTRTRFRTTCARAASFTSQGWSVFSHSGIRVTFLFPADTGMNRSKKQTHPMMME